ncbi:hypothetical protein EC919_114104 [Pseudomonas graminis]|uniref:hypothetical protein n=1 Tax=Pseudomonas graminis TaxID=158627 RepID=UPI00105B79E9|nr:hypothetical protein [Pseudomonas graminis]TDV44432.1 hypothetical protein EC919_114104 [Pseudomonas graminis]
MTYDNELKLLTLALVRQRFESIHDAELALERFERLTTPAAVQELIAESETLRGLYQMHKETETREMRDLKAENERLKRFKTAYMEFSDKTDWVRPDPAGQEVGMHVADVLRKRHDDLTSHCQAQAQEIKALRKTLPVDVPCNRDTSVALHKENLTSQEE